MQDTNYIRPRVEGVILNRQGFLLVGKSKSGRYILPGGGVEEGETPEQAIKRECHEEVGKSLTRISLLSREPYIIAEPNGKTTSTVWCLASVVGAPVPKVYGSEGDTLKKVHYADPKIVIESLLGSTGAYSEMDDYRASLIAEALFTRVLESEGSIDPLEENFVIDMSRAFPEVERVEVENSPIILIGPELEEDEVEPHNIKDMLDLEVATALTKSAAVGFIKDANGITSSAGQLLVNSVLPPKVRDYSRVFNKKEMAKVLQKVATDYPEHYSDVTFNLKKIGDREALFSAKQMQFSDFKSPVDTNKYLAEADKAFSALKKKGMDESEALIRAYAPVKEKLNQDVLVQGVKKGSALAEMIVSGSRGNPSQMTDMVATPMLVSDYKNKPIKLVIRHSYSQGLTPAEYLAASYGTRRGLISTKMAVPKAGYMNKMFSWTNANAIVAEDDCNTSNGVVWDTSDHHNLGRRLAKNIGKHQRGTIITKELIDDLVSNKIDKIEVRSPMTCDARVGVCRKCVGTIETGRPPELGYNVGMNAAAAMTEPLQQGMLSEKHTGGSIKARVGGYPLIKQLVEVPKIFPSKAVVSEEHGEVSSIEKSPWGGNFVFVDKTKHYIPEGVDLKVKEGDYIEKGIPLSEGVLNPADVTRLRGIGEGRKYLSKALHTAFKEMGNDIDRLHFEVAAKSFINFGKVESNKKLGDYLPGDIAQFNSLQKSLKVEDAFDISTSDTSIKKGLFLAKPVLHYTISTEVTPSILKDIKDNNISSVSVSKNKPEFIPVMVRIQDTATSDSDWVHRLYSQGLKQSLQTGVHRAHKSSITGPSFVHPYIYGIHFGKNRPNY